MAKSTFLVPEDGLSAYLEEIKKYPILGADQEYTLAKRWREEGDTQAAHQLVTSHLRLVAKIAMKYRGYGLPMGEVISEGNIGLMQAVKRFEPEKGFRLATYAMWWIRASIQDYVLRSWSLVKLGTTAAQKKLFFNLRKTKGQIEAYEEGDLKPDQVKEIATRLDVSEQDVIDMNRRMEGDRSLNAPLRTHEGGTEWQDWLEDEEHTSQENVLIAAEEQTLREQALIEAMTTLNERERDIFVSRRLKDPNTTLDELAEKYGVSAERIRQIEVRAFEKISTAVKQKLLPAP